MKTFNERQISTPPSEWTLATKTKSSGKELHRVIDLDYFGVTILQSLTSTCATEFRARRRGETRGHASSPPFRPRETKVRVSKYMYFLPNSPNTRRTTAVRRALGSGPCAVNLEEGQFNNAINHQPTTHHKENCTCVHLARILTQNIRLPICDS
ncbi:Hypothetical_protein [Hexamita inflata]|uniref:Hypothetical_protein n=1 Tax=Hexamita inflata TaxID=28002 RepID=A0AA86NX54_9EUKA|nr:Hypothetical protein HINF_LOCUS15154 [Hexamita inflata]